MDQEEALKQIAEKAEELRKEFSSASPGWVMGRIEEIRDIAKNAVSET